MSSLIDRALAAHEAAQAEAKWKAENEQIEKETRQFVESATALKRLLMQLLELPLGNLQPYRSTFAHYSSPYVAATISIEGLEIRPAHYDERGSFETSIQRLQVRMGDADWVYVSSLAEVGTYIESLGCPEPKYTELETCLRSVDPRYINRLRNGEKPTPFCTVENAKIKVLGDDFDASHWPDGTRLHVKINGRGYPLAALADVYERWDSFMQRKVGQS